MVANEITFHQKLVNYKTLVYSLILLAIEYKVIMVEMTHAILYESTSI